MNLEKVRSKSMTHPVGLPGHMQKSALNMQICLRYWVINRETRDVS